MKKTTLSFVMLILMILAACTPEAPLPTSVPTNTPPPPTATSDATATPVPTATMARGIRSLPTQGVVVATPTLEPEPATGTVQFVHAVLGMMRVNYRIPERTLANGLGYGRYTQPIDLLPGQYNVEVVLEDGDDTVLASQPLILAPDQSVIMVLTGTLEAPRLIAVNEDTSPIAGNMSRVMVFNGVDSEFPLVVQSGNDPLTPSLPHTAVSPPFEVPAGDANLNVMEAMTSLTLITDQYRARELNSVFLLPNADNPEQIDAITITKYLDGLGQIRVIGMTDPAYYDVYLNNLLIASGVGSGIATEFEQWVAGEYIAAIYPTGTDPATTLPSAESTVSMGADRSMSIVITGADDTLSINEVAEDLSPTAPDEARVVFFDGVADYTRVQLDAEDNTYVLFYGQATEPVTLIAREASFSWIDYATRNEPDVIETVYRYNLEAGKTYLYILIEEETDQPQIYTVDVGVNEALGINLPAGETEDVVTAARLRVVNAAQDSSIQLSLDDTVFAAAQTYATVTNPYALQPGEHVLTAHDPETNELLARDISAYEEGVSYSAYIYKGINGDYRFLVMSDQLRQPGLAPIVRQVNLSNDEITLGLLAYASPLDAGVPNRVMTAEAGPDERQLAPFGLTEINREVGIGAASPWFDMPQLREANDYYVVEPESGDIMVTLENIKLDNRSLYEFVSYHNSLTSRVAVFVVPYLP